ETPAADDDNTELSDPDDIDALLESMSGETPAADDDNTELSDPDDIDALLESMSGETPAAAKAPALENSIAEEAEKVDPTPAVQPEIKADEMPTLTSEEQKIQDEIAENEAKIAEFTAEYVTPFLTADFSDILTKESSSAPVSETLEHDQDNELNDDFDIDALIADNTNYNESLSNVEEEKDDIGDDLTDSLTNKSAKNNVSDGFSESELSHLLSEESAEESELVAENSPDFNDEDVLADLLKETADEELIDDGDERSTIEALGNVDFDELLANIEEESATTSTDNDYIGDDIGDSLVDVDLSANNDTGSPSAAQVESYVTVDDLLSDSLADTDVSEPYEKTNIDVGLGQYADNNQGIDVDENGSMSSQLDLAKMYLEMNDQENAQVILQEVLLKGDTTQKAEAKKLLDSI
ncbi:FimV/HubP family polar landmark protein, partial [Colwellia ponticola]